MTGFDPVAFTGALIRLPSSDPPGGELNVAEAVHAQLQALGIEAELDAFAPGRANVIGRVRGRGEARPLVFSAHMDTVPPGQQPWSFDPYAGDVVAGRLRGRGASDMKSAIAAFTAAAAEIADGPALAGDVILAFTAGESANCLGARRLVEQGFQAEIGAFLCGEPSGIDLIIAEPAILWVEATAAGRAGHVSGDPGINAIQLMARYLMDLDKMRIDAPAHPLLIPPTIRVGRIDGGSAVNLTPDKCRAEIDIRFGPGLNASDAMAQLRAQTPEGIALEIMDFKPAVTERPDAPFVAACAAGVEAETGRRPALKGVSYYSDGAILLDGIEAPFCILGPGDLRMSGQPDETTDAEAIRIAGRIYARIARDWLGKG